MDVWEVLCILEVLAYGEVFWLCLSENLDHCVGLFRKNKRTIYRKYSTSLTTLLVQKPLLCQCLRLLGHEVLVYKLYRWHQQAALLGEAFGGLTLYLQILILDPWGLNDDLRNCWIIWFSFLYIKFSLSCCSCTEPWCYLGPWQLLWKGMTFEKVHSRHTGKLIRRKNSKRARRSTSQLGMQKRSRARSLRAFHCHGERRQDCARGDPKDSKLPIVQVGMKCFRLPRRQDQRCRKSFLPASACPLSPPEHTPPPLRTTEEKNNLQKWGVIFKPSWAC